MKKRRRDIEKKEKNCRVTGFGKIAVSLSHRCQVNELVHVYHVSDEIFPHKLLSRALSFSVYGYRSQPAEHERIDSRYYSSIKELISRLRRSRFAAAVFTLPSKHRHLRHRFRENMFYIVVINYFARPCPVFLLHRRFFFYPFSSTMALYSCWCTFSQIRRFPQRFPLP